MLQTVKELEAGGEQQAARQRSGFSCRSEVRAKGLGVVGCWRWQENLGLKSGDRETSLDIVTQQFGILGQDTAPPQVSTVSPAKVGAGTVWKPALKDS